MDVALARQYHKRLAELLADLQQLPPQQHASVISRMENMVRPLYPVHAKAMLSFEEAMAQLRHKQTPIVRAAVSTMQQSLIELHNAIENHGESHFVLQGPQRMFARPVAEDELRTLVQQERLFLPNHSPYTVAFRVDPGVESVLQSASSDLLLPTFSRMGFPDAEAIVFFETRALPRVVHEAPQIPSLKIAKIRTGVPITVLRHRVL